MEERYPVIAGAEEFFYKGNKIGILISHGFVGTPQSVQFIGETLAGYGYTVLAPRLPGHGTHHHDLESATYEDWFRELEKGYQFLAQQCSVVFVIGQSMGGTLTLRLAHKYPEIKGIATINAALSLPAFDYLKEQSTPRFIPEGEPDIKDRGVYEIAYTQTPLHAIHQLQEVMASTPKLLSEIQTPILCVKSSVDHVVPPENTDFIYKSVRSKKKRLITLANSYHVASMDNDKEFLVEQLHDFVQSQLIYELVASY
ncbi:alpha/beta fold hydrolase [Bacillus sp. B15-48]|uniref:alpha/beta hydrolase n=1 Tax=Bacillus sp. B15-48 TaxID=1548601 RepID=UPI00194003E4|nr:alpha/beta fold hydrolase [Bacillus sp. B15-48]MBM4763392.1 alpha/beta fold hydrolase [Bacillus sp. B15-48]